jgi:hypothetical protein
MVTRCFLYECFISHCLLVVVCSFEHVLTTWVHGIACNLVDNNPRSMNSQATSKPSLTVEAWSCKRGENCGIVFNS